MMSVNYQKVLPEFFDLMAENERILPPHLLPEILDSGVLKRNPMKFFQDCPQLMKQTVNQVGEARYPPRKTRTAQ